MNQIARNHSDGHSDREDRRNFLLESLVAGVSCLTSGCTPKLSPKQKSHDLCNGALLVLSSHDPFEIGVTSTAFEIHYNKNGSYSLKFMHTEGHIKMFGTDFGGPMRYIAQSYFEIIKDDKNIIFYKKQDDGTIVRIDKDRFEQEIAEQFNCSKNNRLEVVFTEEQDSQSIEDALMLR